MNDTGSPSKVVPGLVLVRQAADVSSASASASSLLGRLRSFLPQMAAANDELAVLSSGDLRLRSQDPGLQQLPDEEEESSDSSDDDEPKARVLDEEEEKTPASQKAEEEECPPKVGKKTADSDVHVEMNITIMRPDETLEDVAKPILVEEIPA